MPKPAAPIVVTGGAGFIGSNLVDALVARGDTVRVIDNFFSGKKENLTDALATGRCELVEADIADRERMKELLKGAELVFHLATHNLRASLGDPWTNHQTNSLGTMALLEAAKINNVSKFIYVSSSEIYGTAQTVPMAEDHPTVPITVYGATKLAGELYTNAYHRTYGLPTVVVRPFNNYGPREHAIGKSAEVIPRFMLMIRSGKPITVFGDGMQTRDFLYVEDTVRGLLDVAACDELIGDTINLARGEEVSILDLGNKLMKLLGKTVPVKHLPERPGDVMRHLASAAKAKKMLSFAPRYSIDEGLKKYLEWCDSSGFDWQKAAASLSDTNW